MLSNAPTASGGQLACLPRTTGTPPMQSQLLRRTGQPAGATPTTTCDAPRQELLPARGVVFSSEVQCPLDTVTASPSHARPAASCDASGAFSPPRQSERSSTPR